MTLHPKNHRDLLLAPVAAEIDLNLQRMRDVSPRDVLQELELELDRPAARVDRDERAGLVLEQALRNVDLSRLVCRDQRRRLPLAAQGRRRPNKRVEPLPLGCGLSATRLPNVCSATVHAHRWKPRRRRLPCPQHRRMDEEKQDGRSNRTNLTAGHER